MPILKQLVSTTSQSKRRSRSDLTAEMISAPLGDFRHTMHVGRGGDAFGDTSFLSTRTGEPPQQAAPPQNPPPKQGLLSRTFRSSKRSQSVNRSDRPDGVKAAPSSDLSGNVKTAISLPYLNNEDPGRGGAGLVLPKSMSAGPAKQLSEGEWKPTNGAAAAPAVRDVEQDERSFGELTDLPVSSAPLRSGMKHAESIMSFHVDLGPSMLGDILSVMDKKGLDDSDLGYEEGCGSPMSGLHSGPEEEEEEPAMCPSGLRHAPAKPRVPEHRRPDSYSLSSSESAEKLQNHNHQEDTDNMKNVSPRATDDRDFTYMDEGDDDEIRV